MVTKMQALSMMGGTAFISGLVFYLIGYSQAKTRWKNLYDAAKFKAQHYQVWYKKYKSKYEIALEYAAVLTRAARKNPHK